MSEKKPYLGEDSRELDDDTQSKPKQKRVFTPEERAFRRRVGLEIEGETEEDRRIRLAHLRARLADRFDFEPPLRGLEGEDLQAFEEAKQGVQKMLDHACKGDCQAIEEMMAPIHARLAEKFDFEPPLQGLEGETEEDRQHLESPGEQLRGELKGLINSAAKRHSNTAERDWEDFDRKLWTKIQKRGLLPCSTDADSRDEASSPEIDEEKED